MIPPEDAHNLFPRATILIMHTNRPTATPVAVTATTTAARCHVSNPYLKPKVAGPRDTRDRMTTYADEGIVHSYDQQDFLRRMNEVEEAERQRRSAEAQELNK